MDTRQPLTMSDLQVGDHVYFRMQGKVCIIEAKGIWVRWEDDPQGIEYYTPYWIAMFEKVKP